MTKRILQIFAVAVIACTLMLNAFAQTPEQSPPRSSGLPINSALIFTQGFGGTGNARLLQNPEFVKMLELTPQQTAELQKIADETVQSLREHFRTVTLEGPRTAESIRQQEEMIRRASTLTDEGQTKIDEVLKPEQRLKLWEIFFQIVGGLNSPMLDEKILEAMSLTDAQKDQVRKQVEEIRAERGAILSAFDPRNQEVRERYRTEMEKANAKFSESIKTLLTAEQRARAEKLTAEIPALRERLGLPPQGHPRAADAGR